MKHQLVCGNVQVKWSEVSVDADGAVAQRRSAVRRSACVDQSGALTESCPNRSSSALASTQTTRRAVTTDVCMTQRFDRRPVTPPEKNGD